jgi:hypothetical protein
VKSDEKITIIEDFFTDKLAESFTNTPNLLISDIRTASWKTVETSILTFQDE